MALSFVARTPLATTLTVAADLLSLAAALSANVDVDVSLAVCELGYINLLIDWS